MPPFAAAYPPAPGRCIQTACHADELWGWALITHPFHPLRGQRFRIIKRRNLAGEPTLILEREDGTTFGVPEEWTDQAAPVGDPGRRLVTAGALLELVRLVEDLKTGQKAKPLEGKEGADT